MNQKSNIITQQYRLSIIFSYFVLTLVIGSFPLSAQAGVPPWVQHATVGSADVYAEMDNTELQTLLNQRKSEHVSVIEIDSQLSEYLDETTFDQEVNFLNTVAQSAHALDMRAVIYYPALEVLTQNGENITQTMFKEHPDWIQRGIDGQPNVFYGGLEHWVEPGTESAWMSPNSGYRDYFLNRIRKLAATALDGVWVDVPIYSETGTAWAGAEPAAARAFQTWTQQQGLGGINGYSVPTSVDFNDPGFRAWIRWRHENIADFVEAIRQAAHEVNPQFVVVIENFPMDYMDATAAGLDGTYRRSSNNFIRVWEVDSVSNTQAMQWSSLDDFNNKITMFKWVRAAERENPSWVFSYGSQPLDAGLVLAAAVATGSTPFEAQTPEMTLSVDSAFRSRWFSFIRNHSEALLHTPRLAKVGVWYSSATRDYQDFAMGSGYGMYVTTTAPTDDPDWWATDPNDSALIKPHLGGYRGAAHALLQLNMPFKIVTDPGDPENELNGLSVLWLPSVAAVSATTATIIKNFVMQGGVVLATGSTPGSMDELGNAYETNILADLFRFTNANTNQTQAHIFGKGIAFYRPDLQASNLFSSVGDPNQAADTLATIEQILSVHLTTDLALVNPPAGISVEIAQPSVNQHHLYIVNASGLQLPIISNPQDITVQYRVPAGFKLGAVTVATPDTQGQQGLINITALSNNWYQFTFRVDQFSLVTLDLISTSTVAPIPTALPIPTVAPVPTALPIPTVAPVPTALPIPTVAPVPTAFPIPTVAPVPTMLPIPTVAPAPSLTIFPNDIVIATGVYDRGSLASFSVPDDSNTYDVIASTTPDGSTINWYATAFIPNPSSITQLSISFHSQFSIANVSQEIFVYNYNTSSWDLLDIRSVSNEGDVAIDINLDANPQHYISQSGETRIWMRGTHPQTEFYARSNYLAWETNPSNFIECGLTINCDVIIDPIYTH